MGILSSLKSLFSGSGASAKAYPSESHKQFTITPAPIAANGQYRIAGTISKGEGDSQQVHQFIRSDTCGSADQAAELMLMKSKVFIDQMGDDVFN
ncbi:transcriptional regulator [Alginatibacterium sediminis]|uniref:Transcriptional regulator n=1 Tax=Alginatibacterium sediminis TaxID=2164068 RepID=A0A420EAX7_9ALTE|nr:HlyU family transcriptional regulator [Alginatibacterium sediminis]RKF17836.1 transcriptional regulator [Alginatibacterium sediminis]